MKLEKRISICLTILKALQIINSVSFGLVDKLNAKLKFMEKIVTTLIKS